MDIKIENNKIQIADISAFTKRTIYVVSDLKDSVTFIFNEKERKIVIVDETTVNGIQMTADNIDELLSPLFTTTDNGSNINIQNEAYTKLEFSNPVVFPTPIRSGHIVEFYKDSTLYQSYQWNGWYWHIIGAEPNLVFTHYGGYTPNDLNSDDIIFNIKNEGKNLLSLKENGDYSRVSIYTKSIDLISKDYRIGNLVIYQDENIPNLRIPSFSVDGFSISRSENNYNFISDSVVLTDCQSTFFNLDVLAKECFLKNIIPEKGTLLGYRSHISITATDLALDNAGCSSMYVNCLQPDKNIIPTSSINIINNNILTDGGSYNGNLVIEGNYDGQTSINADLNISDNIGLKSIYLRSFNEGSTINSFEGSFDKYLTNIEISNCNFNQLAFDNLINSLATIPQEDGAKRNIGISETTPVLTEIQKTALIKASWIINK